MLKWTTCSLRWPLVPSAQAGVFLHVARYASSVAIKPAVDSEKRDSLPPLNSKVKWSLEDDNLMRKLLLKGKKTSEIHAFFPLRPYGACASRLTVLRPTRGRQCWSLAELERLKEMREEGTTPQKIKSQFPLKSFSGCRQALLKLPKAVPEPFTEEERETLWRQRQEGLTLHDIRRTSFPHRTLIDCRRQLKTLRVLNPEDERQHPITYFTSDEIEYIKTQISKGATVIELSRALGRRVQSVYSKILGMGLEINREYKPSGHKGKLWTVAEDAVLLRVLRKELSRETLISHLPHRGEYGIRKRLSVLRKKIGCAQPTPTRWSQAEVELLQTLHNDKTYTLDMIASRLQRSVAGVTCKLHKMTLIKRHMSH